jgi:hypothetical protein
VGAPLVVTVGAIDVGVAGSASTPRHSRKATTYAFCAFHHGDIVERCPRTRLYCGPSPRRALVARIRLRSRPAGADGSRWRPAQENAGAHGPGPRHGDQPRFHRGRHRRARTRRPPAHGGGRAGPRRPPAGDGGGRARARRVDQRPVRRSVPYRNGRRPWTPSSNCRRSAPRRRSATAAASRWVPASGYR